VAELAVEVLAGHGRGPAAARNLGWRRSQADWVAFVDDDVVPGPRWFVTLTEELGAAAPPVVGVQGDLRVPLPSDRRPTDWERNVARLERAQWITADMAFRRDALRRVGGFDERFRAAYREDSDLALRLIEDGGRLVRGRRRAEHPVRPAGHWVSVHKQAGNHDDALMRRRHGPSWRHRARATGGRLPLHVVTTTLAAGTCAFLLLGRRKLAAVSAAAWAALWAEFTWARVAPGPRDRREIGTMCITSAVIPPVAVWHRMRGELAARRRPHDPIRRPDALLLDRDGTIVHDVPYNGDPAQVRLVPDAKAALDYARAAGLRVAVVTNQSGVARGWITLGAVDAVNARIEAAAGPFAAWLVCPHGAADGCACRKPAPGLLLEAAARLGTVPERCVMIGDTGADMDAARRAGARGILVPNDATLAVEVREASQVAPSLLAAVEMALRQ
jgi:histidinol-phosphate phosphatase family protein